MRLPLPRVSTERFGMAHAFGPQMARFLVVDDDPASVEGMTRLLHLDGHEVSPFTEGARAIDALAREPFDAIVTDLEMPKVDGTEVVRAARQHAPGACLIVTTAKASAQHLYDAGACMLHEKPVEYDTLVDAVRECRARGGSDGGACHAPVSLRRR